ncbi:hypothetical protein EMCG_03366 [[Emmonsia] crescens]|uniref:Uncharacterized protein n=1 Tax=[Emmonsia] crescens TaxID=73230 RepID=A0A0G2HVN3_9EURO|nr:hypothetical protein EMCG_03366 [Emmonsia crescens UAMH 3008]
MKLTRATLATLFVAPMGGILASPINLAEPGTSPNNLANRGGIGIYQWCSTTFSCQSDEECRMQLDCYKLADGIEANIFCYHQPWWNQCTVYKMTEMRLTAEVLLQRV